MLLQSTVCVTRLVGGTRQRHFAGTNFKPRKLPENAHCEASHQSGARCVRRFRIAPDSLYLDRLDNHTLILETDLTYKPGSNLPEPLPNTRRYF